MFTSVHFQNFRGFVDLKLEGLKGVNLVVGRNNSGKTSLLEGIAIAADPSRLANDLPGLLRANHGSVDRRYYRWLVRDDVGDAGCLIAAAGPRGRCAAILSRRRGTAATIPAGFNDQVLSNDQLVGLRLDKAPTLRCRVVSVQHRAQESLVKLFAQAVKRKGGEETIETLMKSVDSRVNKLRVEPSDDGNHILVDIGLSEMLPLPQVGQGICRLVAIFSELIGEEPDLCMIDEVENGIHHSLLEQVWAGLAAAAESLKIQIFATTHSWECIEAAHAAFAARPGYDFSIVQLFRASDGVQGRVLDRQHIEAALAGQIDLR